MPQTEQIVATKTWLQVSISSTLASFILISLTGLSMGLISFQSDIFPIFQQQEATSQYDNSNSAKLIWTAPGDDGYTGQASGYDIRYAQTPITSASWSSATQVANTLQPKVAGASESFRVTGLLSAKTYYFAVRAYDEVGNYGEISNVPSITTACYVSWSCDEWSACVDGQQVRTCSDTNSCASDEGRPEESRACGAGGPSPEPIIVGTHTGYPPHLRVLDSNGGLMSQFYAYAENFRNGVNFSFGDVDGDGKKDIVVGTIGKSAAHIRIFRQDGSLLSQFFAYPAQWRIGVSVSTGDLDGDGKDEIIVLPNTRSPAHVRIFSYTGQLQNQFYVFPSQWRLELNLESGDVNGDGKDEIVVSTTEGYTPHVRIFSGTGNLVGQFFAYDLGYRGGVPIATGDTNGDGKDEIITGTGPGYRPHVRILDLDGSVVGQFNAYDPNYRGGLTLSSTDVDGDGVDEVIVGTMPGYPAHVRALTNTGDLVSQFYAYPPEWKIGVKL